MLLHVTAFYGTLLQVTVLYFILLYFAVFYFILLYFTVYAAYDTYRAENVLQLLVLNT